MYRIEHEPWYPKDHPPMKPYALAQFAGRSEPVELISYPWREETGEWKINVRITIGDPTSLATVDAQNILTI